MEIITNNARREPIDAWELTAKEQEQFDYLNWPAIANGEDSAQFIRYKGELYDLGDFEGCNTMLHHEMFPGWDGYISDTFFSGILIKWVQDKATTDWYVICGRYYA
jgi:hypothetical protein